MHLKHLSVILIFCTFSCATNYPEEINETLSVAGKNKKEILRVFKHYKNEGDSLKLKAAIFLISNMSNKIGYTPAYMLHFFPVLDSIKTKRGDNDTLTLKQMNELYKENFNQIRDEILFDENKFQWDAQLISSEMLIENIDYAFKAWREMPWAQHIDFEQFCEYILPYRIYNESLSQWRKYYYEKYSWIKDSVGNVSEPEKVCEYINRYLTKNFATLNSLEDVPALSFLDNDTYQMGLCEHGFSWMIGIMRSLGIPSTIDFTPVYSKRGKAHDWVVVFDTSNTPYGINGAQIAGNTTAPSEDWATTKAYRNTFEINTSENNYKRAYERFPLQNFIDVSNEYPYPQTDIQIKIPDSITIPDNTPVYLCCLGYNTSISPIDASYSETNTYSWSNVACNTVFVLAYYSNNEKHLVGNPFTFTATKPCNKIDFNPDYTHRNTVSLTRKYFPYSRGKLIKYANGMVGGRFEGANKPNFSDAVPLYTIQKPFYDFAEQTIKTTKRFRYVRYIPKSGTSLHLAEIGFYKEGLNGTMDKLSGTPIVTSNITLLDYDLYCDKERFLPNTNYYWRVDEKRKDTIVKGPLCTLKTGNNIAPLAIASASSETNSVFGCAKAIDAMIDQSRNGRWVSKDEKKHFLKLTWETPRIINKIVVYDNEDTNDHAERGIIVFSDGSRISIDDISPNGRPKIITFPEKAITYLEFQITNNIGGKVGLSEIEVYTPLKNSDAIDPTIAIYESGENYNITPSHIQLTWKVSNDDCDYNIYFGKTKHPVLKGTIEGVRSQLENAFDNDAASNCNLPEGSWIGLDFCQPETISQIRFLTRNDLNVVEPNDVYELFYYDQGFRSLGKKTSSDYNIQYESVPSNCIYLLRDISKGKQERIFEYKDSEQYWW